MRATTGEEDGRPPLPKDYISVRFAGFALNVLA